MKPNSNLYYAAAGVLAGTGFATIVNCFGLMALNSNMVIASALYVGWGLSLYYYDDEIKVYLGVTE